MQLFNHLKQLKDEKCFLRNNSFNLNLMLLCVWALKERDTIARLLMFGNIDQASLIFDCHIRLFSHFTWRTKTRKRNLILCSFFLYPCSWFKSATSPPATWSGWRRCWSSRDSWTSGSWRPSPWYLPAGGWSKELTSPGSGGKRTRRPSSPSAAGSTSRT